MLYCENVLGQLNFCKNQITQIKIFKTLSPHLFLLPNIFGYSIVLYNINKQ